MELAWADALGLMDCGTDGKPAGVLGTVVMGMLSELSRTKCMELSSEVRCIDGRPCTCWGIPSTRCGTRSMIQPAPPSPDPLVTLCAEPWVAPVS